MLNLGVCQVNPLYGPDAHTLFGERLVVQFVSNCPDFGGSGIVAEK